MLSKSKFTAFRDKDKEWEKIFRQTQPSRMFPFARGMTRACVHLNLPSLTKSCASSCLELTGPPRV